MDNQNKIIDNLEDSVVETTDKINKTEKNCQKLLFIVMETLHL